MFFVAFLLFKLGITQSNGNFEIFYNATNPKIYVTFGYIMIVCLIPFFATKRHAKEYLILSVGAVVSFSTVWLLHPDGWGLKFFGLPNFIISSAGIGLTSIIMVLFGKNDNEESIQLKEKLVNFYIFVNLLQFSAFSILDLSILLHPITLDTLAFHIDATFGFLPSEVFGKIYTAHPFLTQLLSQVYELIALGFAIIYCLQLRGKRMPPANMLLIWAVSTISCLVAYHLCPISGPLYLFGPNLFPGGLPDANVVTDSATMVTAGYRNGLPSMHFGTCLMFIFTVRYEKSRILNLIAYILAGLTILATLGNGQHYLIDLVVSFPFIVAIQAFCTHVSDAGKKYRHQAILAGVGLWLMWVVLVRFGASLFEHIPGLVYVISALTIGISLWAYRRQFPYEQWGHSDSKFRAKFNIEQSLKKFSIVGMFFISGFTGLMYEVVFSKELALTFGSMATATYTVLAVYMGGMAIGSWLGGFLTSYSRKSGLVLYAGCELLIGIYCIATPFLFDLIRDLYVALAHGVSPDAHSLVVLRVVCGSGVLLVPTILMGITLPVMATELQHRGVRVGNAISKLYSANTLGAACGALLSGYLILPLLGINKTIAFSAVGSMGVALLALKLNKQSDFKELVHASTGDELISPQSGNNPRIKWAGLIALLLTGCVTMLMEVNYMQLLAVVAGNSAYAFSLMLFSLLLGLAAGAAIARHAFIKINSIGLILSALLIFLSCVLFIGIFQWNNLPSSFAVYSQFPYKLTFYSREMVRAMACWLMMFPPAVIIGACYPITLELVASNSPPRGLFNNLGSAISLNTLGNIIGATLGGFILLPLIGSQQSIALAAGMSLLAGLLIAASANKLKNPLVLGLTVAAIALFYIQPASFDYTKLSSGANVYFQYQDTGKVIGHAESLDGGLTSVSVNQSKENGEIRTLLTNGKFQGNDALLDEMQAQIGFAILPLLHTALRDSALVIGYGTGVSSHAIKEAGFRQVDIVDLSADLIKLSNTFFSKVNGKVSEQPGVNVFTTDGRNYLLLQDRKYDLISVEITSIGFAGAASLYNHEFYELAANRLNQDGVLQQWVQLHHLTPIDLACILSSARTVFPNVSLYVVGGQGIIIANKHAQQLSEESALQLIEAQPGLMNMLHQSAMEPDALKGNLLLSANDVNNLVKTFSSSSDFVVSTDDNLFLEYSTPKGNALDAAASLTANLGFLRKFSSTSTQQSKN